MKLDDAMRHHGFDEHKVAQSMVGLANHLEKKKNEPKVFLDLLKEGIKVLWVPPRAAERALANDSGGPVPVILVHNVARPVREFIQQPMQPFTHEPLQQKEPQ